RDSPEPAAGGYPDLPPRQAGHPRLVRVWPVWLLGVRPIHWGLWWVDTLYEGGSLHVADQSMDDRVLVIVEREDLARYASLKRVFASESADVILDRRRGERRGRPSPPSVERRRGDRRLRRLARSLPTRGRPPVRRG